ncbi:MAG: FAD-dependent monooxygenase [Halofilum sp. (in: g-proteobacteria)]|nr:FAD-dependent monooxygenase [Halofilum sp. (in: g-proteobacteria)]
MTVPDYDVLISGGGPAGSALALALADGRRRIAVVEPRAGGPGGDARATALSEGSVRLLGALGAWPALAAEAVPIRRVEVSQQGHPGRTRIDAADEGVAALGQVVALERLGAALAGRAQAAAGVDWLAPARVVDAEPGDDDVRVTLAGDAGDGPCRARLVVAADGTGSPLREALGIATRVHDYDQTALLADIDAGGDPYTALERFSADGPLALLPGGGRRRTLVWTVAGERAAAIAALEPPDFAAAAARRLGRSVGRIEARAAPAAYPLRLTVAARTTGPRAALVGNAARTLHPVAAQGFNLALRDVCALAAALRPVADPGDAGVLAGWRRGRRGDQRRTQAFTDLLARGFHGGGLPGGAVRAGALLGLDLCAAGRHALAAQTMGLVGGLPRVGWWRLGEGP